jgi:N-carbamoyl-L-amino-acid hydrolase
MKIEIDIDRLSSELAELALFSEHPAPAVTRVVFTEQDREAREYFAGLCAEAGLKVRTDAVGNTFATWLGSDPSLPAVATGSHIDAIPNAGMYDGTVGVLGGLEAIRALKRSGAPIRRSIELILFTSEEPTRFGIGCLGSRIMSGALSVEKAGELRDSQGKTLDEARTDAGFIGSLDSVLLREGSYAHFVELHIEQGPNLENSSTDIGLVTSIAAPASGSILIEGEGGHAGGVLMPGRKDALAAAAEIILATEAAAKATGAIDTVATIGICEVFPGAVNSIPSRVKLSLDVRDTDLARRDGVLDQIARACERVGLARGTPVRLNIQSADAPATCSETILSAAEAACKSLGATYSRMVSRAYHDSLFMSRIAPTAMIFIPCRGGVSHRPDEYSTPEQIAIGTQVLAHTLFALAN